MEGLPEHRPSFACVYLLSCFSLGFCAMYVVPLPSPQFWKLSTVFSVPNTFPSIHIHPYISMPSQQPRKQKCTYQVNSQSLLGEYSAFSTKVPFKVIRLAKLFLIVHLCLAGRKNFHPLLCIQL